MSAEEATRFRLHSLVLTKMGNTGLFLLVLSGAYLIIPYWNRLLSMPLLIAKLILVVILAVMITALNMLGRRAHHGDPGIQLKKMEPIGKTTLLVSIVIVILAVTVFH